MNRNEIEKAPSPKVIAAIRRFDLAKAPRYFDGYYGSSLALELSRRFNMPRDQVSVGYGIEFFLRSIFDSCNPKRDVVLANTPHYTFYSFYAQAKGVRLETFRLADKGDRFEFDVEDCIKKIRAVAPKIVLITSPNNPTGNSITAKNFERILRAAPRTSLVVLDEAYVGFDDEYKEAAFLKLLKKYENMVILRSFSKRYALAGLRIGFALWGTRAKSIIRYDDLYLGGSQLLEDVAVAALNSEAYYRKLAREIITDREQLAAAVNKLKNFTAYESHANFVLVKIEPPLAKNFSIKSPIAKIVMPGFMRVSLGSHKHIAGFIAELKNAELKLKKINGRHD